MLEEQLKKWVASQEERKEKMGFGSGHNWSDETVKVVWEKSYGDKGAKVVIEVIQKYCDGEPRGTPQLIKRDYFPKDGKMQAGYPKGFVFQDWKILKEKETEILALLK